MAKVSLQVRSIMNLGLWDKVCEYHGWNPWIVNEGRLSVDEWVEFDDTFEKPEDQYIWNKMNVVGTVSLQNGDSPNDFIELFEQFMDDHGWTWSGKVSLKD